MPCMDPDGDSVEVQHWHAEATKLGQMLCWLMARLEEKNITVAGNPALAGWWAQHKAVDAERRKREEEAAQKAATRAAALAKLTPEERKALGV